MYKTASESHSAQIQWISRQFEKTQLLCPVEPPEFQSPEGVLLAFSDLDSSQWTLWGWNMLICWLHHDGLDIYPDFVAQIVTSQFSALLPDKISLLTKSWSTGWEWWNIIY